MVLLLTGAIDIKESFIPSTTIIDTNDRLSQYLESIDYAITHYESIPEIVFCENTNFSYDYTSLKEKAINKGKKLEVISFSGDYISIKLKGKGFGEGEIIQYALNNSKLLEKCDAFIKLTGRLIVTNMDRIVATTATDSSFIYHPKMIYQMPVDHIETFLYKADKKFYIQHLIDAHQEVDESRYRYLEHIFYERLSNFELRSFNLHPNISGLSGTSGNPYESGIKATIFEKMSCFIGIHNLKKTNSERILAQLFSYLLKIRSKFK